jgi:hypothetical protein
MQTVTISGYVIQNNLGSERMTAKAIFVTVDQVNGDERRAADSIWLAKSLCTNLRTEKRFYDDGGHWYAFTAEVPAWWVSKLDFRAAWEIAGYTRPPSPVGL